MKTQPVQHFIFVDDDPWNNTLCELLITKLYNVAEIKAFTEPERGLEYIQSEYVKPEAHETIVFLDINMPTMTGWDFLEAYERFNEKIKKQLKIFILSSSIDQQDKDCASKNINVVDFIVKP